MGNVAVDTSSEKQWDVLVYTCHPGADSVDSCQSGGFVSIPAWDAQ